MLRPLAREAFYALFRMYIRFRCLYADWRAGAPTTKVKLPPAMLRFRVSECLDPETFLRIGRGCAQVISEKVKEVGIDIDSVQRVLDFGCGCGRTIVWFMRDHPHVEFHGVDVDPVAVEWCQINLPNGHFAVNLPQPPLHYPDGTFDVVYCLSVFTHLDETMQDAWLAELVRVIRPGGALLLTVHGKNAVNGLLPRDLATLKFVQSAAREPMYHGVILIPLMPCDARILNCGSPQLLYVRTKGFEEDGT